MRDLIEGIEKANGEEIEAIFKAVLNRYRVLYPEWELSTISIRKNEDRNAQLDSMIMVLQRMKTF